MSKIRIYELAKELGWESKDFTIKLKELGYDIKTSSSSLDDASAEEIRTRLGTVETKVEKKRIQSKGRATIIRRRTKVVRPAKEESPAPVEEEADEVAAEDLPSLPEESEPASVEESPAETMEDAEVLEEPEAVEEPELEVPQIVEEAPAEEEVSEKEAVEEAVVEAPQEEPVAPIGQADEQPVEQPVKQAEEPAKAKKKEKKTPHTGLARVIKKSAIDVDLLKSSSAPKPKRSPKPKGRPAPAAPAVDRNFPDAEKEAASSGKGKKGKRFVKFHPEPGAKERVRKGGKRKGPAEIAMEDIDALGGRIPAGVKVGRSQRIKSKKGKSVSAAEPAETKAIKKRIKVFESISVSDLAHRMGVKSNQLIANLMGLGVMATLNQALDIDTATLVAADFGYEVEQGATEEQNIINLEDQEAGGEEFPRPPVVTVMGHVDHGKTSILDAIRKTDVAEGEAGGITQHIGAHFVHSPIGDVVFLDTPGHAAFTEMRSRGAQVTDVVVLVVAADDGVMDQTKEAINHAKAAEVPIVVAVNKIDKPEADIMRIKSELAEFELSPEEWGGTTIFCETSAKQNIGIEELLEQILLQAEMLELKADPKRRARGWVVEAQLHKGRGPVATILVQQGTLSVGDYFVVGNFFGKVRALSDDKGKQVKEAGPAIPVEVHGLSGVPQAGDEFICVPDEKLAKTVAQQRQLKNREATLGASTRISLDNLFEKLQEGEMKEIRILLRSDVQGTLEAFAKALNELSTDAIKVKILHQGTGTITDSDILLAAASDALIIGFNVRPSTKVQDMAQKENVDLRFYDVIYHALDDIKKAMAGLLEPTFEEEVIGSAEVRETFHHPKIGTIAGCYVTNGLVKRNAQVRVIRDGVVAYTGKVGSLKRFKDDAKEVQSGYECGITVENFNDIKVGDVLEPFQMNEVAAEL